MFAAIPDIDEGVRLPPSAADALPELSPTEELQMRARTIALLAEIQGKSLIPDEAGQKSAEDLARQMIEDPKLRPEYSLYPNETIAYLAGMVSQINYGIVEDLADLKTYVINKLVWEIENAKDSKSRITALKALGDVDGVNAFQKRSEVTVVHKPLEQVETELKSFLERFEGQIVEDAEIVQESPVVQLTQIEGTDGG
jgi:hypothetical protein